jgi:AcrR family transcriptional regulator
VEAAHLARRAAGARTRSMLLDVAEARFADEGVEAVSIRSINAAAGLAPAAVHYHFGTKQRLLAEVVNRRGVAVHAGQVAAVARLEAREEAPTTVELVEALAMPFFDLVRAEPVGGRNWVRLATRSTHANDPW